MIKIYLISILRIYNAKNLKPGSSLTSTPFKIRFEKVLCLWRRKLFQMGILVGQSTYVIILLFADDQVIVEVTFTADCKCSRDISNK